MTSHDDIATRWLDIATGKSSKSNYSENSSSVFGRGDTLYSWGTHFALAKVLRDKKSQPRLVLLNGESMTVSTTRHQRVTRNVVDRSGLPQVIIPFEALDAAGINHSSVVLIDRSNDRNETIKHQTTVQPEGSRWTTRPYHGNVALTPEEQAEKLAERNAEAYRSYCDRLRWAEEQPDSYFGQNPPKAFQQITELSSWDKTEWREIGTETFLHFNRRLWSRIEVTDNDDGTKTYSWETHRHWLGESVIRATVRGRHGQKSRTRYFLSGFDHQEPRPSYFFCELPRSAKPTTLAEAYEALKPKAVVLAESMGRPVVRQGDIFGVSLTSVDKRSLRKRGARFEKRGNLLETNHEAAEVAYLPDGTTLARGILYHNPGFRAPDHRRVRLTPGWSVIVKNTVPVTK